MEIAITATLERDRERLMRQAEKRLYTNVERRSQQTAAQNKELESLLSIQLAVSIGLLDTIRSLKLKLESITADYQILYAQFQRLQGIKQGLINELYMPSTERLETLLKGSSEETDKDGIQDKPSSVDTEEEEASEGARLRKIFTTAAPRRKKQIGKRAKDLARLICQEIYDTSGLDNLDALWGEGNWEVAFWDVVESIEFVPATVYRKRVYYPVIRKRTIDPIQGNVFELIRLPRENALLAKSLLTPSLMAAILYDKFVMYLPLYRQEHDPNRFGGFPISRQIMSAWIVTMAQRLKPFYDYLVALLLQQRYLQCDETTWLVIHDVGTRNYFWVQRTGELLNCHPIVIVGYESGRSTEHLRTLFAGIDKEMRITSDAYSAYYAIQREMPDFIVLCGCFMHARRYFTDAFKILDKKGFTKKQIMELEETKILHMIAAIYKAEMPLKELTSDERKRRRDTEVRPLVDAFFQYVRDFDETNPLVTAKMREAIQYSRNHETELRKFLEDGNIPIDNGAAERAIRPIAMSRRNCLFSNTIEGARANASFLSFIETAEESGVNSFYYLKYLLEHSIEIAEYRANLDNMLPWSETYRSYEEREKQEFVRALAPPNSNYLPTTPKIRRRRDIAVPA